MGQREAPSTVPAYVAAGGFAVLPYASLVAHNRGQTLDITFVVVAAAVTVAAAVLPVFVAARVRGAATARRLAVFGSAVLWTTFHFQSIAGWVPALGLDQQPVAGWALTLAAVAVPLVILSRTKAAQLYVAVLGVGLVAVSLVPLTVPAAEAQHPLDVPPAVPIEASERPNVYFLLVDGFGSPDVLADRFSVDLDPFVGRLESQGFVVSREATANYPATFLSLASTLSMDYIAHAGDEIADRRPFYSVIRGRNPVVETFTALGYRYMHASSGLWEGGTCSGVEDVCIQPRIPGGETAGALLETTPFADAASRLLAPRYREYTDPSRLTDLALEQDSSAPFMLFAHVLAPHPPYLRKADCSPRATELEVSTWGADPQLYGAAVTCVASQLHQAVEKIGVADPTAIVVIQGDHGPGFSVNWNAAAGVGAEERLPIFSAMRVPSSCRGEVPRTLSAVNTFRLVLTCLDQGAVKPLATRHYWGSLTFTPVERIAFNATSGDLADQQVSEDLDAETSGHTEPERRVRVGAAVLQFDRRQHGERELPSP